MPHDRIALGQLPVTEHGYASDGTKVEVYTIGADGNVAFQQKALAGRNLLDNGSFQVWQQGTGPFTSASTVVNNDDTYLADQWIYVAEGADCCDVSQETTIVPTGSPASIKFDKESTGDKFGMVQILRADQCKGLLDGSTYVTLSYKARIGSNTTVDTIYGAILAWSGTADSVTSDVVTTWGAEGTLPTAGLATSWTAEAVSSAQVLNTGFQTFEVSGKIDTTSVKQIAVFIWCENDDGTATDTLYISDVKLEIGRKATPYLHKTTLEETVACKRHFDRIASGASWYSPPGVATTASQQHIWIDWQAMYGTPTLAVSDMTHFVAVLVTLAGQALSSLAVATSSETATAYRGGRIRSWHSASSLVAGDCTSIRSTHASATLDLDSRL